MGLLTLFPLADIWPNRLRSHRPAATKRCVQGNNVNSPIQENLAAGFVARLTKPIRIDSLEKVLADSTLACR
jgi:hypothetical protein